MQTLENENSTSVGEMKKNRVLMADGRRYLIYYTFGQTVETTSGESKIQEHTEQISGEKKAGENV